MSGLFWEGKESRKIVSRILIEGDLVLQSPAHFGSGDTDEAVDMPLLVDPLDGCTPLLTGASIAGALRSYLREWEQGYGQLEIKESASTLLFGVQKDNRKDAEEGEQSPLIVEDALGKNVGVEIRSGVTIDSASRTSKEDQLFNIELWKAGTTFPLRFELILREEDHADRFKQALATALNGLENGSITLGARKRRGYGRVQVPSWRVKTYDLTSPKGLLDWIKRGNKSLDYVDQVSDIQTALGVDELLPDTRRFLHLEAAFSIDGSLLVGSGGVQDYWGSDRVHLQARQADGRITPVLPGTSLAGVLRARALKIVKTLAQERLGQDLVEEMFGPEIKPGTKPEASRFMVFDSILENVRTDLVQKRVAIDRFTGGARDTALFDEQPAFGSSQSKIILVLRLFEPRKPETGLLLLLLKDLWMGDLPLGSGAGIGRGRLKGREAKLFLQKPGGSYYWEITAKGQSLMIEGNVDMLEQFVTALKAYLEGEVA